LDYDTHLLISLSTEKAWMLEWKEPSGKKKYSAVFE
jgi:hypothetical protein